MILLSITDYCWVVVVHIQLCSTVIATLYLHLELYQAILDYKCTSILKSLL